MPTSRRTNPNGPSSEEEERPRLGALLSLLRGRRVLLLALALSLLVHLLVAMRVRWPFEPPKSEVQTVHLERIRTVRVARMPTPPPPSTPRPPSPRPSASPHPRATKKAHPARTRRGTSGTAHPQGSTVKRPRPQPTPRPLPTSTCSGADTPAALAASPAPPEIAPGARGDATSGTARIRVKLDATGAVVRTTVVQTSGNGSLDLVALSMARHARYTPATHACRPVAGTYVFSVRFVAW